MLNKKTIPTYLKVALTDALYCLLNKHRIKKVETFFVGNLRQKAQERAQKLLQNIPSGSKVLLLGAVTEIIEEASRRNVELNVFDLESQKLGLNLRNVRVDSGNSLNFTDKIKNVDYIVATGMIFVSNTADEIFKLVNENDKKLIMYMESGSNFGESLIKFGAETVLSEYFPYYDFFGDTKYSLFQK